MMPTFFFFLLKFFLRTFFLTLNYSYLANSFRFVSFLCACVCLRFWSASVPLATTNDYSCKKIYPLSTFFALDLVISFLLFFVLFFFGIFF
jgi:hypothetical protein